tara:strand:- start:16431 stop:17039 length:609 start_codon:yes stop_codon:yes gene_type:complete
MTFNDYAQIFGSIAGLLTALAVIYKYILSPIWATSKRLVSTINKLDQSLPILLQISHEFRPNGGNSLRDIIDRIEAELELSKARTKTLLGMSKVGVFEADRAGKCMWVNRKWCELAGILPEEAVGNGWVTSIHPEDREMVFSEWVDSVNNERNFDLIYRFKNPQNGKIITVQGHSNILRNRKTNYSIYLGTVTEITEGADKK